MEEIVLSEKDDKERGVPVAKESEEVLQHDKQLVAAGGGESHDGAEDNEGPDKAGESLKRTGELLHRKGGGIEGYAIHSH